jgi:hypothetical protein
MGRYSSVQAYADNNPNMRQIQYNQEAKEPKAGSSSSGAVKVEKVVNPYGSTAGAGSGEFHVYRHARAREMARMKGLDDEEEEQKDEAEHQQKLEGWKTEEQKRLEKKRKKRARGKSAKVRKKNLSLGGVKEAVINKVDSSQIEEEFDYKPLNLQQKHISQSEATNEEPDKAEGGCQSQVDIPSRENSSKSDEQIEQPSFQNDGSFMELMRKQMMSQESAASKETEEETKRCDETNTNTAS